nr:uncharacterized protein LOC117281443 [Nicotiana tomentosiformis]
MKMILALLLDCDFFFFDMFQHQEGVAGLLNCFWSENKYTSREVQRQAFHLDRCVAKLCTIWISKQLKGCMFFAVASLQRTVCIWKEKVFGVLKFPMTSALRWMLKLSDECMV